MVDGARLDDEEVASGVARREQDLARLDARDHAQRAQPRPLLVVQTREGAVAVGRLLNARPNRGIGCAHP